MSTLHADTAQARETDRHQETVCRDFFADPDARVEPVESASDRESLRARIHRAMKAMEMICSDPK